MNNNQWVIDLMKKNNIDLIGFADLSVLDAKVRQSFPYGICIAIKVDAGIVSEIPSGPHMEYYNEYKRINHDIRIASRLLADEIVKKGYKAYSLTYEKQDENYRTVLPYKTLATRSGLGWIGKSATLVTKEFGNAIRLNGVLTDMPVETGIPIEKSLCGDCMECTTNCPGQAIAGNLWDISTDRDELLNAWKCKKSVIERGKIFNITEGSCGICLAVCPWTKKYIKRQMALDLS